MQKMIFYWWTLPLVKSAYKHVLCNAVVNRNRRELASFDVYHSYRMTDKLDHLRAVMESDDDDTDKQFETRQTLSEQPATPSGNRIRLVRPSSSTMDRASWNEFSSQQEQGRDTIRLFDGENTPQNISSYGFLLGIVCGGGLVFAFMSNSSTWHVPQFGLFLTALALFHFLEYLATALFNPDKLTLDCKYKEWILWMIYHSKPK